MHINRGLDRRLLSLVALFLFWAMVAAAPASPVPKATVAGADGTEAVDDDGAAFGKCKEAPQPNDEEVVAEDSPEEVSDGAEEASTAEEEVGRDCANEEAIDPDADYN